MQLVIYLACQERLRADLPSVRVDWNSNFEPEDLVSMGIEFDWKVVYTTHFQCHTFPFLEVVLAHVHPVDLPVPPESEWDSYKEGGEAINIDLVAIGEPHLQLSFDVLGQAPTMGTQIMMYEPTSHETALRAIPTDWVRESFNRFRPLETSPYKAVYLTWCKQKSLVSA